MIKIEMNDMEVSAEFLVNEKKTTVSAVFKDKDDAIKLVSAIKKNFQESIFDALQRDKLSNHESILV